MYIFPKQLSIKYSEKMLNSVDSGQWWFKINAKLWDLFLVGDFSQFCLKRDEILDFIFLKRLTFITFEKVKMYI